MLIAFGVLGAIISHPERLKICVMKTFTLLRWIDEIEGTAWSLMIDLPLSVIVPRHSFLELMCEMTNQVADSASNQRLGSRTLGTSLIHQGVPNPASLDDFCVSLDSRQSTPCFARAFYLYSRSSTRAMPRAFWPLPLR